MFFFLLFFQLVNSGKFIQKIEYFISNYKSRNNELIIENEYNF